MKIYAGMDGSTKFIQIWGLYKFVPLQFNGMRSTKHGEQIGYAEILSATHDVL